MKRFVPCQGKTACRDDGERCLSCGRSFVEIHALREALDQLASLALEYDYQNSQEFSAYVARKLDKMIVHRRQEEKNQIA